MPPDVEDTLDVLARIVGSPVRTVDEPKLEDLSRSERIQQLMELEEVDFENLSLEDFAQESEPPSDSNHVETTLHILTKADECE